MNFNSFTLHILSVFPNYSLNIYFIPYNFTYQLINIIAKLLVVLVTSIFILILTNIIT